MRSAASPSCRAAPFHLSHSPLPLPRRDHRRIGLLGGSFNPAHAGHRHISLLALRQLDLHEVWWLISPQNPLKASSETAPLIERLRQARRIAAHPRIRPTTIEARYGTRYTVDTLRRLCQHNDARFVWLIGADNLVQLPRWRRWRQIVKQVPVAVFDRASHSFSWQHAPFSQLLANARCPDPTAPSLADAVSPAWVFVHHARHPASSTALRAAHAAHRTYQETRP